MMICLLELCFGMILLTIISTLPVFAANNTIELRNDNTGENFFYCAVRACPEEPVQGWLLTSKEPDIWVATKGVYNGRAVFEEVLWAVEIEYEKADAYAPGTEHALLINKNIPKGYSIQYPLVSRETEPCQLSKTFRDHALDWDFLRNKAREVISRAGLKDDAGAREKAQAIAEFIASDQHFSGDTFFHPVDFCLYGSWCTGRANTTVALASTLGIPGRVISMSNHTVPELFIEGQWRFVEGKVYDCSLLEFICDPAKYNRPKAYKDWTCQSDGNGEFLFYNLVACSNWIFNLEGAYPENTVSIWLDLIPDSARALAALYPEKDSLTYKCDGPPIMRLTPYHANNFATEYGVKKISQTEGLRQSFYLSELNGAKRVTAALLLPPEAEYKMPADGGGWYYLVNGQRFSLKEQGGWQVKKGYQAARMGTRQAFDYLEFELPLAALRTD